MAQAVSMTKQLRVGIMGAGSIGCYVGGRLAVGDAAHVVFVGRARQAQELSQHGLTVQAFDGPAQTVPPGALHFETDTQALADCDAVLCCVKSAHTEEVARALAEVVRGDCLVASLQNGLGNTDVLRTHVPGRRVLPCIVGFNVVSRGGGLFHQAMSGSLMFEGSDDAVARALFRTMTAAGLDVELRADLVPDQWTKLIVNLNNAVSALSGAPTRQLLAVPAFRRVVAAVMQEAVDVLDAAGITPAKLRGVPVWLMPRVLRLPTPLVRLVTRAQMRVDPEARSSMWEDLVKGRPTEVSYLNGEIVRLAESVGRRAPRNQRLVELIGDAERAGPGSPNMSAERLWQEIREAR